jgi:adenosine deaminase
MGMNETELTQLVDMSFEHAFLSEAEKLHLKKSHNF